jgi:hypothetical protein
VAADLAAVLTGAGIGLIGGLGGVYLGHRFSTSREEVSRSIAGLAAVMAELGKLRRLALYFHQRLNIALLEESDPGILAAKLIDGPWQEATHELQEANWVFPCMAYLPQAEADFRKLDGLIRFIMDPYSENPSASGEKTRGQAIEEFMEVQRLVRSRVQARLRQARPNSAV